MIPNAKPLFAISLLLIFFPLHAQKLYFLPSLGYAHGVQGDNFSYSYAKASGEQRIASETVHYRSGPVVKFGFGYSFKDVFGIDIALGYQNKLEAEKLSFFTYSMNGWKSEVEFIWRSQSVSLTPSLRVGSLNKTGPFLRVGPSFQYIMASDEEGFYPLNKNVGWYSTEIVREYEPAIAVGVYAEAGMAFRISDKFGLTGAVAYQGLSFFPERSEITSYREGSVEKAESLPPDIRETFYSSNIPASLGIDGSPEPSMSGRALPREISFNSVSLYFGFVVHMN